jgi:hypothetical protein
MPAIINTPQSEQLLYILVLSSLHKCLHSLSNEIVGRADKSDWILYAFVTSWSELREAILNLNQIYSKFFADPSLLY